jgi:SAM-dependent methyltransferase
MWSYDLIAEFYATDMGQSMPFDDVGYYAGLATAYPGQVLELGCGSGRILIELLARGIDIVGADRSLPMLEQCRSDAAVRALTPRLLQMDLRAFALHSPFSLILAPYSLITYLTDDSDVDQFIAGAVKRLAPGGALVLDAFVPRDVTPFDDFREDYTRAHGNGRLVRAKRIARLADGCNRIERRYRHFGAEGELLREVLTQETIRPYAPQRLRELVERQGLRVVRENWDYGAGMPSDPRFCTLVAAR